MAKNYSNTLLYKALKDKYVAAISEAEATIEIYFNQSVGIGEHPQHVEEMDKLICKIADAEDKLDTLHAYFGDTGEDDKSDIPSG
tara:strand:+ start:148 stop:402 length:255 start_codon:yes stop_codon:yes gene_type:complete